jgi:hypothetical protein
VLTFWEWLETYFTVNPAEYDELFDQPEVGDARLWGGSIGC